MSAKNQLEVSCSETDMTISLKAKAANATINEYTGPETYNVNAINIEGTAGKAENAFNTYCGNALHHLAKIGSQIHIGTEDMAC